jgi:hypothetical protein
MLTGQISTFSCMLLLLLLLLMMMLPRRSPPIAHTHAPLIPVRPAVPLPPINHVCLARLGSTSGRANLPVRANVIMYMPPPPPYAQKKRRGA